MRLFLILCQSGDAAGGEQKGLRGGKEFFCEVTVIHCQPLLSHTVALLLLPPVDLHHQQHL